MVDEGALVAAARAGDRGAYLRLAGLWQARVRAVAGGLAGSWRGEELARAAVTEAWRRLPTMPPGASFGPWLLAILHELASGAAQPPAQAPDDAASGWTRTRPPFDADEPPEPPAVLGLRAALADLEAPQREAFLLAGVAGLGYDDVAAVVGRSLNEVSDDVYRARVRLAAVLADPTGGGP
jgi:DNA-directed RNA polymerase specialized sigma24 family protein